MKVYLVEFHNYDEEEGWRHEMEGVFSSIERAIDACTTENHYYIPFELDEFVSPGASIESVVNVNIFYPKRPTSLA